MMGLDRRNWRKPYTEDELKSMLAAGEMLQLSQRVQELEKFHELDKKQVAYLFEERNILTAERDKATQYWQIAEGRCDALKQQKDELLVALENLLPWVVTQTVACNGMKCRELVCISCTDESDAEQYAQEACDRYQDAKQAIASVKEK